MSGQPSAVSVQLKAISWNVAGESSSQLEMRNFRELKVWEKAHRLTLSVYHVTRRFPAEELYGLTSQMRRSSASISTNIAEGCGRDGDAELARFLQIAMGSASELEYQILLAGDLGYVDKATCDQLESNVAEVKRMLAGLIKTLKEAGRHQRSAVSKSLRADS